MDKHRWKICCLKHHFSESKPVFFVMERRFSKHDWVILNFELKDTLDLVLNRFFK